MDLFVFPTPKLTDAQRAWMKQGFYDLLGAMLSDEALLDAEFQSPTH